MRFYRDTPGTLIEEKEYSLVWHYRKADVEFGSWQARELVAHLTDYLANQPVEVTTGKMTVEIRPHSVNKGNIFSFLQNEFDKTYDFILAIGDDVTDEDMFSSLKNRDNAHSVKVSSGNSKADYRIKNPSETRALLREFLVEMEGNCPPRP